MDPHLFGGKHNLSKCWNTRFAVYAFMALASLASQLVSGETEVQTGTKTRFAELQGESGEQLIGGELKISIGISGTTSRPEILQIRPELSMQDTSASSSSSNSIPRIGLNPTDRRILLVRRADPGPNPSPETEATEPSANG